MCKCVAFFANKLISASKHVRDVHAYKKKKKVRHSPHALTWAYSSNCFMPSGEVKLHCITQNDSDGSSFRFVYSTRYPIAIEVRRTA